MQLTSDKYLMSCYGYGKAMVGGMCSLPVRVTYPDPKLEQKRVVNISMGVQLFYPFRVHNIAVRTASKAEAEAERWLQVDQGVKAAHSRSLVDRACRRTGQDADMGSSSPELPAPAR